jgi:hypothetical protein
LGDRPKALLIAQATAPIMSRGILSARVLAKRMTVAAARPDLRWLATSPPDEDGRTLLSLGETTAADKRTARSTYRLHGYRESVYSGVVRGVP